MTIPTTSTPIHTLIETITQKLMPAHNDHELCTQYAWWMLENLTNKNKSALLIESSIALPDAQAQKLSTWINEHVNNHVPLQYLLGHVPFIDCDILVEKPILIPRPETEAWCVDLISELKKLPQTPLHILDLCTGSGCIAIALAKALPYATITATDINPQAIALAQKNAEHNKVSNIEFIETDLFEALPKNHFDLIVTNPPYIPEHEWQELNPSVKNWEDSRALTAPDEGLSIIKAIIHTAPDYLKKDSIALKYDLPQLTMEIGHNQGKVVQELFKKAGYADIQLIKDIHNKDRVIMAK